MIRKTGASQMNLRRSVVVIAACVVGISANAQGTCQEEVNECVTDCNAVLDKCTETIGGLNDLVKMYEASTSSLDKQIVELQTQLAESEEEAQAWYRNPAVVGALGLVVGVYAAGGHR